MRRAHVMPGGVWPPRMGVSSRRLSILDQNSSDLVNATDGGTWAPDGPIVIGGAGMTLNASSLINGGITTRPGYGGNDPKIELDSVWPFFSTPRTRKVCVSWSKCDGLGAQPVYFDTSGACIQTGASAETGLNIGMIVDGRYLHEGATLTKATFSFRYSGLRPTSILLEGCSIARYRRSDDVNDANMHTPGVVAGITYTGTVATRVVGTIDACFNGGNVINVEYVPDRNNVISKSTHYYGFNFNTLMRTEAYGIKFEFSVTDQGFE